MDQLLIALDVNSGTSALSLADALRGVAGGFKIGSRLFTSEGPEIVRALATGGNRVFLDLKYHDIPNTVASAIAAAAALGVWMVTVHASGGSQMMRAARDAARDAAARENRQPPLVIGVTVLTSMSAAALSETGIERAVLDHVVRLAELAQDAGLDGVVVSPHEAAVIRRRCGAEFTIVTPGIRDGPAMGPTADDHARTMNAAEALEAGANYIVVGRPIIDASDPRRAAERIVEGARRVRSG